MGSASSVMTELIRYDRADHLRGITYPDGRTVDYTRDNDGQVTSVTTQADAGAAVETVIKGSESLKAETRAQ